MLVLLVVLFTISQIICQEYMHFWDGRVALLVPKIKHEKLCIVALRLRNNDQIPHLFPVRFKKCSFFHILVLAHALHLRLSHSTIRMQPILDCIMV